MPTFQHGDAAAKKRLPAITWQAFFAGKRRSNANAIPSGLYMLDLDHLEGNTAQIFTERIMPHVRECGILLVHTTPSGHGLRVVARMQRAQSFPTIREFQLWLAAQLGFKAEEVDLCTKDMARLSFVPPEPYVHYHLIRFSLSTWRTASGHEFNEFDLRSVGRTDGAVIF